MSSLVTGAGGFVGQWLIRALLGRGEEVTGFTLGPPARIGVLSSRQSDSVKWCEGDIRDPEAIADVLYRASPRSIYHLAGVTFVPAAGEDPTATYDVNTMGVVRLLAALARFQNSGKTACRVLVIGSGEQYGQHDEREYPLPETAAQKPMTVYAASKTAQEVIALQTARAFGLEVVATRSFNHSGLGQDGRFLLPGLVRRIKMLRLSGEGRLAVGNTTSIRDFLHVGDVVRAYIALMERGVSGEVYNVSSGEGRAVADIIERVLRISGVRATPEQDESLVRPIDVKQVVGDNTKLRKTTGWKPERSIDDIISDLWNAPDPLSASDVS